MLSSLVAIPFDELVDRPGQLIFHLVDRPDQLDYAELVQTLDKRVSHFNCMTGDPGCCCVDLGPEVCNSIPDVSHHQHSLMTSWSYLEVNWTMA